MPADAFPATLGARLRWIGRECLCIGGILVAWIGIGLGVLLVLSAAAVTIQALRLAPLRFVYAFASRSRLLWPAVTQLAAATTGLYVVVRAGTLLIDRYRTPLDD